VFTTVFNFRDLGGLPGHAGRTVHYGRLYRSDSLHRLTDVEGEHLAALGIRTVLDLRRPKEIARDGRIPELPGIDYHNVHPIHQEWDPTGYDPATGPERFLADRYLDMAENGTEGLGEAIRLIAEADRAPLVMHCFAGKDRTGVLSSLTLSLLGVTPETISIDYARSGAAQAGITEQALRDDPTLVPLPVHFLACPPGAMLLFLEDLSNRYGSVQGYAERAGVTGAHVDALRDHLLS
jgi:hypothetical protein